MSGGRIGIGNGIFRAQQVDRENEIVNLKWRGTEFQHVNPILNPVTGVTLNTAAILSYQTLSALAPNAITGPSAAALFPFLAGLYLNDIGSRWTIQIENTDPVNTKTITFGAGFTPAAVSIPPLTTVLFTWEVTSQNPPSIRLINSTAFPAGGMGGFPFSPVGSFNVGPPVGASDVLVWDPTLVRWVPSGLSDPNRYGRFPGLKVGAANTAMSTGSTFNASIQGNTAPNGVLFVDTTSTNLTTLTAFDVIRTMSSVTNFGTRAVDDCMLRGTFPASVGIPGGANFTGAGGYSLKFDISPATVTFKLTADGKISTFLPFNIAAASTALVSQNAAPNGIGFAVSLRQYKKDFVAPTNNQRTTWWNALFPTTYRWLEEDTNTTPPHLGFVVEDTEEALNDAANTTLFSVRGGVPSNFDDRALISLLVATVKTLQADVIALTARVTALEAP